MTLFNGFKVLKQACQTRTHVWYIQRHKNFQRAAVLIHFCSFIPKYLSKLVNLSNFVLEKRQLDLQWDQMQPAGRLFDMPYSKDNKTA
jgi:hypothetical protein